jgi:hypothetical protein
MIDIIVSTELSDMILNGSLNNIKEYGCSKKVVEELSEIYNIIRSCTCIYDLKSFPWLNFKQEKDGMKCSVSVGNGRFRLVISIDSSDSILIESLIKGY